MQILLGVVALLLTAAHPLQTGKLHVVTTVPRIVGTYRAISVCRGKKCVNLLPIKLFVVFHPRGKATTIFRFMHLPWQRQVGTWKHTQRGIIIRMKGENHHVRHVRKNRVVITEVKPPKTRYIITRTKALPTT